MQINLQIFSKERRLSKTYCVLPFGTQGFSGSVEGGVVLLADGRLVLALGTGLLVRLSPSGCQHDVITGHKYSMISLKLKGHGNDADFLGFLQIMVSQRSLTLPFEPFRFWLQIRGDISNRKTTPRLSESPSRRVSDSPSFLLNFQKPTLPLAESGSRISITNISANLGDLCRTYLHMEKPQKIRLVAMSL